MSMDQLPPLREVISEFGLAANKAFGQHFLLDLNLTAKIARLAGPLEGHAVIEVGPGPGGLTRALLAEGASRVIAIEADERFFPALEQIHGAADGRLTVIHGNALDVDERDLLARHGGGMPAKVVSNLPYNVGTPLLITWLSGTRWWSGMTLMFQKEVAERVVAPRGDGAYGRLGVISALRSRARLALKVPARAFTPPPKVESAVVVFDPPYEPAFSDVPALERVTAAAFGQRRKMLRRSLKGVAQEAGLALEELCSVAGARPDARPEELEPAVFAALAQMWRAGQRV